MFTAFRNNMMANTDKFQAFILKKKESDMPYNLKG